MTHSAHSASTPGALTVTTQDDVLTLHLPVERLGRAFLEGFDAAIPLMRQAHIRLVVITGVGALFSKGFDPDEIRSFDPQSIHRRLEWAGDCLEVLRRLDKPVVAAVNGPCLGGGLELALACDLRLSAETARFGLPEVDHGLVPGLCGGQELARLIGYGRAMEMVLLGSMVDASEAHAFGLVSRVMPRRELPIAIQRLAAAIRLCPPHQLAVLKRMMQEGRHGAAAERASCQRAFPEAIFGPATSATSAASSQHPTHDSRLPLTFDSPVAEPAERTLR